MHTNFKCIHDRVLSSTAVPPARPRRRSSYLTQGESLDLSGGRESDTPRHNPLVFLWAIGDLFVEPGISMGFTVVDAPFERMLEPGPGPFAYEAVAAIAAGVVLIHPSPINLLIGLSLGGLVALNAGLIYLAIRQPRACGLEAGSGVMASVPALFAGGAWCAPVIFIASGITATGTMLTVVSWLLPVGIVLLIGSSAYIAEKVDPHVLIS